jgi:ferritin
VRQKFRPVRRIVRWRKSRCLCFRLILSTALHHIPSINKSQLTLSLYLQNSRGGCIVLHDVGKPAKDEWGSPLEAIEAALDLEKEVNQSILDMHGVASARADPHLCDFLETHFVTEQVEAIKELADWATKLRGVGSGLGEHIIDGEIGA